MKNEETELTCIICPIGCSLKVYRSENNIDVKGALCQRGIDYAKQEILDPRRVVMSVIRVKNGDLPVVSIKTSIPIPKKCISEIMKLTALIEVEAPIEIGEIIVRDICGADIVATRRVNKGLGLK
jgi:CxxC motif-containing protein